MAAPVCRSWFGARDGLPAHGFVRTRLWQLRTSAPDASGQVVLRLGLNDDASTRALWDFAFELELMVTVGATLTMALISRNTGGQPFTITDALHIPAHAVRRNLQRRARSGHDCTGPVAHAVGPSFSALNKTAPCCGQLLWPGTWRYQRDAKIRLACLRGE